MTGEEPLINCYSLPPAVRFTLGIPASSICSFGNVHELLMSSNFVRLIYGLHWTKTLMVVSYFASMFTFSYYLASFL